MLTRVEDGANIPSTFEEEGVLVSLTTEQKKAHIQAFILNKKELDTQMDECIKLFGGTEGRLYDVIYTMYDNYLDTVATIIGDEHHWLSYYVYDCQMGEDPKEISIGKKDLTKEVKLDSIDALVEVIEYFQTEENENDTV